MTLTVSRTASKDSSQLLNGPSVFCLSVLQEGGRGIWKYVGEKARAHHRSSPPSTQGTLNLTLSQDPLRGKQYFGMLLLCTRKKIPSPVSSDWNEPSYFGSSPSLISQIHVPTIRGTNACCKEEPQIFPFTGKKSLHSTYSRVTQDKGGLGEMSSLQFLVSKFSESAAKEDSHAVW